MRDDPTVIALVEQARAGDHTAWDEIVERYAPLVWSVTVRHGLTGAEADDIGGTVWLRLLESLDGLRTPAALPGWIATTARRECLRAIGQRERGSRFELTEQTDTDLTPESWLLEQERHLVLRSALARLSERCRTLLTALFGPAASSYADISRDLGIPVGAIGPTRQRCLAAMRGDPLVAALGWHETEVAGP